KAWKRPQDRPVPDVSAAERAIIERHNANIDRQVERLSRQLEELRRPCEQRLRQRKLATLPEAIRADTEKALATPPEKRDAIQKYLAGKFEKVLHVKPEEVD